LKLGGNNGELLGRTDTPEFAGTPWLVGIIGVIAGPPKVELEVGGGGQPEVPVPGGKTPVAGGAPVQGFVVFNDPGAAPPLLEGNCTCCANANEFASQTNKTIAKAYCLRGCQGKHPE
jgi:hypothetical protein